jgi:DNA-binding CsgD family transcriptional regulator
MLSFDDVQITSINNQKFRKNILNHEYLKQTYNLTKRELELCDLFVNGMNLEQVAEKMGLTRSSIRTYLRNIFAKTPAILRWS